MHHLSGSVSTRYGTITDYATRTILNVWTFSLLTATSSLCRKAMSRLLSRCEPFYASNFERQLRRTIQAVQLCI
jgi:hypothetical protein